jgi:hypothetical protein
MTEEITVRGIVLNTYGLDVILYKNVGNVKMTNLLDHVL